MKNTLENSDFQSDEEVISSTPDVGSTVSHSPTLARNDHAQQNVSIANNHIAPGSTDADNQHPGSADPSVDETDQTVISQRPIAPPEEFFRTMPLADLAALLEGKQLDHFAVEQMIGGGGMGAVFRGRDLRLDRIVAIKVIPATNRDLETLRRFRLEAQSAARLDHPNIARVYYVGEAEKWNYIVFEFIDGANIRDLVELQGPLSVDDTIYYIRQVAEALQHALERNVVHRDIKPSNVLVTSLGLIKVVDMGLARNTALDKSSADATASGITLGTFDYISPEQARDPRDADVRSDLYSLGCTMFYMLTGSPPFPDGTALQKLLSHGSQAPPDPRAWRDDLSDELIAIVMKLMAKRPTDRYQKPIELINDLLLLAEHEGLARSRSTGTVIMTASPIGQSFIEANLPWMVALAFLLGSSFWLASMQSFSSGYEFPQFTYENPTFAAPIERNAESTYSASGQLPEPAPLPQGIPTSDIQRSDNHTIDSDARPPNENQNGASSAVAVTGVGPAQGSSPFSELPIANPSTLVVSEVRDADTDPRRWSLSISDAVRRVREDKSLTTIEIRGRQWISNPLNLAGLQLEFRGNSLAPAIIEFDPQILRGLGSKQGLVEVRDAQLRFRNLAFRLSVPSNELVPEIGLFEVLPGSNVELASCSLTVRDPSQSGNVKMILARDRRAENSLPVLANSLTGSTVADLAAAELVERRDATRGGFAFSLQDCLIRGQTSVLNFRFEEPNSVQRVEVEFDNVLAAVTGVIVDIQERMLDSSGPQFVRLFSTQSTFVAQAGFARLSYQGTAPKWGLNRTSELSVYWSAADNPHIRIEGIDRRELLGGLNLAVLQGIDNAYDQNVAILCHCLTTDNSSIQFEFLHAQQSGWFREPGHDRVVHWNQPWSPTMPMHLAQPEDLGVAEGMFMPGIREADIRPPQ